MEFLLQIIINIEIDAAKFKYSILLNVHPITGHEDPERE
jgi:hypothetical protein